MTVCSRIGRPTLPAFKRQFKNKFNPIHAKLTYMEDTQIVVGQEGKAQLAHIRETGIESMLMMVIEKGLPIETLEKLLAMRKELKAEAAREAFIRDMARFQAECPVIRKDKHVKFNLKAGGSVDYWYAPMDSIIEQVHALIGQNGFSYSFKTEEVAGGLKAICIVQHREGHSDTGDFTATNGGTSMMSASQVTSSTETFAKRKAFCNAFGITTGDEDNDGAKSKEEDVNEKKATVEQHAEIDQLIAKAGVTKAAVVQKTREHYSVAFPDITGVQAQGLIEMLQKKIADNAAKSPTT